MTHPTLTLEKNVFLQRAAAKSRAVLVAGISGGLLALGMLSACTIQPFQPDRSHPPMEITNNPTTYCIGRILIDLPENLQLGSPEVQKMLSGSVTLGRITLSTQINVSLEEYERLVNKRWGEIKAYTHRSAGSPYERPSIQNQIRKNGILFGYHYRLLPGDSQYNRNGQLIREPDEMVHSAEGYYWENGTLFIMKSDDVYKDRALPIVNLMSALRYRTVTEVPRETGICLNGGFVEAYYRANVERFFWSAKLPQGLEMGIFISTGGAEKSQLQQFGGLMTHNPDDPDMVIGGKKLRVAKRPNDHLTAEELVTVAITGYDEVGEPVRFKTVVNGTWEFIGEKPPQAKPYVRVELGIAPIMINSRPQDLSAYPSSQLGSFPSQSEFMALWDAVMSTIRFYPSALTPKPEPQKPEPPPIPNARQISRDKQMLDDFLKNG